MIRYKLIRYKQASCIGIPLDDRYLGISVLVQMLSGHRGLSLQSG
jgi:hypothetical protein